MLGGQCTTCCGSCACPEITAVQMQIEWVPSISALAIQSLSCGDGIGSASGYDVFADIPPSVTYTLPRTPEIPLTDGLLTWYYYERTEAAYAESYRYNACQYYFRDESISGSTVNYPYVDGCEVKHGLELYYAHWPNGGVMLNGTAMLTCVLRARFAAPMRCSYYGTPYADGFRFQAFGLVDGSELLQGPGPRCSPFGFVYPSPPRHLFCEPVTYCINVMNTGALNWRARATVSPVFG